MNIKYIGYISQDKRWTAEIIYNVADAEKRTVFLHVDELNELQELVENQPSFCAIDSFKIFYNGEKMTIKESFKK